MRTPRSSCAKLPLYLWKTSFRAGVGSAFGAVHGLAALTVIVPLLGGVHPRMATERSGPGMTAMLEPPGVLSLNYGVQTPVVTLIAHVAYGAILGGFLQPR